MHLAWKDEQRDIGITASLGCTDMGRTRSWNKGRLEIAVGRVAISDHTAEIQRGGYFSAAHIILVVHLWARFLPCLRSLCVEEPGSPLLTNTAGADTDLLQQVKHVAGLSFCLAILQSVYTDNLQWPYILRRVHMRQYLLIYCYIYLAIRGKNMTIINE